MQNPTIHTETTPTPATLRTIQNGLRQYNEAIVPSTGDLSFAVVLRAADGEVCGGLLARAGRGWLRIGSMWVAEAWRGRGYGRELLAAAEAFGRKHGCHSAHLDTFSFQARPFYERCGYEVFGILDNYPKGHQRYFMRKSLLT